MPCFARRLIPLLLLLTLACTESTPSEGEPAATVTPTPPAAQPTSTPVTPPAVVASGPELTYRNRAGALALAAPGPAGAVRTLSEGGPCRGNAALEWSSDGQRLACLTRERPGEEVFSLLDVSGKVLLEATTVGDFSWSARGEYVAYWGGIAGQGIRYRVANREGRAVSEWTEPRPGAQSVLPRAIWSPAELRLALAETGAGPAPLPSGAGAMRVPGLPLAWALGGSAVIAATNYNAQCPRGCFEAVLFRGQQGEGQRLPQLDNGIDFWPSPDGRVAAFPRSNGPNLGLALLDLQTGEVRMIEGSRISYPGEGIPGSHVDWSPDSAWVYWFDPGQREQAAGLFRARSDASELAHLWDLKSLRVWFSPDVEWVAYLDVARATPGSIPLRIARVGGTEDRELPDFAGSNVAWRP